MTNVKIRDISIYHPEHVVTNEQFFEHFDRQGKDIRRLLTHLGRDKRYQIPLEDQKENGITMAIEASKRVLAKAGLTGRDMDMIIFTTQTPEQMLPMNALFVHEAIEAPSHTIAYDLNGNCAGMNIGVEQASTYIRYNPQVNRALIIGSDHFTPILNPEEELTYPFFGDAACAVILEKTEEASDMLDAYYYSNPKHLAGMVFPEKGLANMLINGDRKQLKMTPFDDVESLPQTFESIRTMYDKFDLKPNQLKYCFSQTSLATINQMKDELQLNEENVMFIADRFGYPGTSSSFIALHEGIESGQIKRGDYVLMWAIGAGYQFVTTLFKY